MVFSWTLQVFHGLCKSLMYVCMYVCMYIYIYVYNAIVFSWTLQVVNVNINILEAYMQILVYFSFILEGVFVKIWSKQSGQ